MTVSSSGNLLGTTSFIGRCDFGPNCMCWCLKALGSCDQATGSLHHAISQICDEKTGITVLKRLSHGGLDATASVVDVSATPMCCTAVAGKMGRLRCTLSIFGSLIILSAAPAMVRNPGFCPPSARNIRDVGDDAM
jgi:hypothetical protein